MVVLESVRDGAAHESMRDGGASDHERCWCIIAREIVLHDIRRGFGA